MVNELDQRKKSLVDRFKVATDWLDRYRNIIGIGVIAMLITFSFIFVDSINEQRKIAESCGFTDGKLRCICTQDEWDRRMNPDDIEHILFECKP